MLTGIGLVLAEHAWITRTMAAFGMGMELLAPLGMFSRIARATVIPGLFAMLLALWYTHGFSPRPFYPLFAWFVPWDAVWMRLREGGVRASAAARTA